LEFLIDKNGAFMLIFSFGVVINPVNTHPIGDLQTLNIVLVE